MKRLALIFPGVTYTADKPLLYYSRRIAEQSGYETRIVLYGGFPKNAKGDKKKMQKSYEMATAQAKGFLAEVCMTPYEDVLFIGKSIGSIVAAEIAAESPDREKIRIIAFTPMEETFAKPIRDAVIFTGSDDPLVGGESSQIPGLCAERNLPCFVIQNANHSLESPDPQQDIRNLHEIMERTASFIRKEQLQRT